MRREKKTLGGFFETAVLETAEEDEMNEKKMTPKERLVETVIEEMKEGIKAGQIFKPFDFEGWEKYRKRISRMPVRSIRGHLNAIRSERR